MATTINSITGVWKDWTPGSVPGAGQATVLGAQVFSWGTPNAGELDSLSFLGSSPPAQSVSIGDSFVLGTLLHKNRDTSGTSLTGISLELTVRFNTVDGPFEKFTLHFTYSENADPLLSDTLTLADSQPLTVESGELRLTISGFSAMSLVEGQNSSQDLVATLLRTPFESESCSSYIPVFQPEGCVVDPVCPIEDGPIIEDCTIPDPPGPITDCPEIDVPVGFGGSDGSGSQGPPGSDGAPGCEVRIETTYETIVVYNCRDAGLVVTLEECLTSYPSPPYPPTCCFRLHFTLYLCYYEVFFSYGCCPFLWCDGVWFAGDDYFCAGVEPPLVSGDFDGQLIFKCDCFTTTTTTSTTPSPTVWPDTLALYLNWNIDSPAPADYPGSVYADLVTATKTGGSTYEFTFLDNGGHTCTGIFIGGQVGESIVNFSIDHPQMGLMYVRGTTNGWDGSAMFTSSIDDLYRWPSLVVIGSWYYMIT